jgi:hypothetical protein
LQRINRERNFEAEFFLGIEGGIKKLYDEWGTVEFSSEITISSSFTAECAENAEALEKPSVDCNALKLCTLGDLRGDTVVFWSSNSSIHAHKLSFSLFHPLLRASVLHEAK